jgi:hypothetical protein
VVLLGTLAVTPAFRPKRAPKSLGGSKNLCIIHQIIVSSRWPFKSFSILLQPIHLALDRAHPGRFRPSQQPSVDHPTYHLHDACPKTRALHVKATSHIHVFTLGVPRLVLFEDHELFQARLILVVIAFDLPSSFHCVPALFFGQTNSVRVSPAVARYGTSVRFTVSKLRRPY